ERGRIERLDLRERLREERRDLRERALDPRLARALREAFRVPKGERSQAGERLEQVEVVLHERAAAGSARPDAQHAPDLAAPDHRSDERVRDPAIRIVGHPLLELVVGVDGDRTLTLYGEPGDTAVGRELEADEALVEPVHRRTAERAALGVQEVAVGGVDADELRHL